MGPDRHTEPICVVCEISEICVRIWTKRDARALYRDDRDSSLTSLTLLRAG
jgi:hypothetical protein